MVIKSELAIRVSTLSSDKFADRITTADNETSHIARRALLASETDKS